MSTVSTRRAAVAGVLPLLAAPLGASAVENIFSIKPTKTAKKSGPVSVKVRPAAATSAAHSQFAIRNCAAHPAPPRPRAAERLQRPQGVREGRGAPVLRREVGPPRAVREQLLDLGRQEGQVRLGTYLGNRQLA